MTEQTKVNPYLHNRFGITDEEAEQFRSLVHAALGSILVRGNSDYETDIDQFGIVVRLGLYGVGRGGFSIDWETVRWWRAGSNPTREIRRRLENTIALIASDLYLVKG